MLKSADGNVFPLSVGKAAVLNISAHLGSMEENNNGGYLSYRISKVYKNFFFFFCIVQTGIHMKCTR